MPIEVLKKGLYRGPFQFGFEMGTSARTYVPSSCPYVLAFAIVLLGPDLATGVVPAAFGFAAGRAVVPWLRLRARTPDEWDRRLDGSGRIAAQVASLVLLVVMIQLASM